MKILADFITRLSNKVKKNGNFRLVYYLLITVALLAAFLMLPEKEIGFVYNNF